MPTKQTWARRSDDRVQDHQASPELQVWAAVGAVGASETRKVRDASHTYGGGDATTRGTRHTGEQLGTTPQDATEGRCILRVSCR